MVLQMNAKHLGGPQRTGLRFTVAVPRTSDTEAVISMLKKKRSCKCRARWRQRLQYINRLKTSKLHPAVLPKRVLHFQCHQIQWLQTELKPLSVVTFMLNINWTWQRIQGNVMLIFTMNMACLRKWERTVHKDGHKKPISSWHSISWLQPEDVWFILR